MKHANRSIAVVASLAVLIGAVGVFAGDWPQWRGPQRDGKVSAFKAPQKWPSALTEKWKVTVGLGDATPALVGDRLYVFVRQGADEVTLCLNANDGNEVWKQKYEAQAVSGPARSHPGPRSSPTVGEGKVVTLGVGGVLSCLDAATGNKVWRKDEFPGVVPAFFTGMSPMIVDGLCIAHLGGRGKGAIIAFDLDTGAEKWKWSGDGPAYDSPVLMTVGGTKQVVTLTEKTLLGLAVADGKPLWQVAAEPRRRTYNSATPIVEGQTVIYTGQGQGTRAVRIEKQGDGFSAKEIWTNGELGTGFNTPVLKNGLVFGLSPRGNLFCLKADTGQTAWTDATRRDRFGSILDAGSVLLALFGSSELIAYKAGDSQYEELARIKVSDTPTYAHPVVDGNRIFTKDRETVTLWTVE